MRGKTNNKNIGDFSEKQKYVSFIWKAPKKTWRPGSKHCLGKFNATADVNNWAIELAKWEIFWYYVVPYHMILNNIMFIRRRPVNQIHLAQEPTEIDVSHQPRSDE